MSNSNKDLARRFVDHTVGKTNDPNAGDMFADKVTVGHIYDESQNVMDGKLMAVSHPDEEAEFQKVMPDYKADPGRIFWSDDGFVFVRTVAGTLRDGTKINYCYSAVATVKDGKITQIEAYQDRGQAEPLGKAMAAMRSAAAA